MYTISLSLNFYVQVVLVSFIKLFLAFVMLWTCHNIKPNQMVSFMSVHSKVILDKP